MGFLDKALEAYFESKRHVSPQHTNRASQAGFECARRLQWLRTKWSKAALPDLGLQRRFEIGNIFEPAVMRRLEDAGLKITQRQRDLHWEKFELTGHLDGLVVDPETGEEIILEAKSCSRFVFEKISKCHTAADVVELGDYLRGYVAQAGIYCLLLPKKRAVLLFVDKESFRTHSIDVSLEDGVVLDIAEKALKNFERVNEAIKEDRDLPPEAGDYCARCPFVAECMPDLVFQGQVRLLDMPEVKVLLETREELAPMKAKFEEIDEQLKKQFTEDGLTVVGDFMVKVKSYQTKKYDVPEDVKAPYAKLVTIPRRTYSRMELAGPEKAVDEKTTVLGGRSSGG